MPQIKLKRNTRTIVVIHPTRGPYMIRPEWKQFDNEIHYASISFRVSFMIMQKQ